MACVTLSSNLAQLSLTQVHPTCWFDSIPPEVTEHILSFAVQPSTRSSVDVLTVSKLFKEWGQGFLYETINIASETSAMALDFLWGGIKYFGYENGRRNFSRVRKVKLDFACWFDAEDDWAVHEACFRHFTLVSKEDGSEMFPNLTHLEFLINPNFNYENQLWLQLLGDVSPPKISFQSWPSEHAVDPFLSLPNLFLNVEELIIFPVSQMIPTSSYPRLRRLVVQIQHDWFMTTCEAEMEDLSTFWDPIAEILLDGGCDHLESVSWEILVNTLMEVCPFTVKDVDKQLSKPELPNGIKPKSVILHVWEGFQESPPNYHLALGELRGAQVPNQQLQQHHQPSLTPDFDFFYLPQHVDISPPLPTQQTNEQEPTLFDVLSDAISVLSSEHQ